MALWTPARLATPITWGKADDLLGVLNDDDQFTLPTVLPDASGQGHPMFDYGDGTWWTITFQTNVQNGLPVLRGDTSVGDFCEMHTDIMPGVVPTAVSVAMLVGNLPASVNLWGEDSQNWITFMANGNVTLYAGTQQTVGSIADGGFHVITTIYDGAASNGSVDGTASGALNPGSDTPSYTFNDFRFTINNGGWGGKEFKFDLGEVVVCDGAWSTDERQRVEGYLAHRWGLAANLPGEHPYKAAAPTVDSAAPARSGLRYPLGGPSPRQRTLP